MSIDKAAREQRKTEVRKYLDMGYGDRDIGRATGIPVATVNRLKHALAREGHVAGTFHIPPGGNVRQGHGIVSLGMTQDHAILLSEALRFARENGFPHQRLLRRLEASIANQMPTG